MPSPIRPLLTECVEFTVAVGVGLFLVGYAAVRCLRGKA